MNTLQGKTVLLTRSAVDTQELREALTARGAEVLSVPTIAQEPAWTPQDAAHVMARLPQTAWVAFCSRNAVRFFCQAVSGPIAARLAAIGPGTADELRLRLRAPDLVAALSTAEGLAEALLQQAPQGEILLPQAEQGRPALRQILTDAGLSVRPFVVYRTVSLLGVACPAADVIVLTSPSCVRGLTHVPEGAQIITMGATTSAAAKSHGLSVAHEAFPHTLQGLVAAVERAC